MIKKIFVFIILMLTLIVSIKIIWGELEIKMKIPYNNPIYKVNVNELEVGPGIESRKTNTILPGIITFSKVSIDFVENSKVEVDYGSKINFDVKGYFCYSDITGNEKQVGCSNNKNYKLKSIANINYYRMKILGGSTVGISNDIIYDGKYKNDVSDLLANKGKYQVEIYLNHENINSEIYFMVEVK